MENNTELTWHNALANPAGEREGNGRGRGKTMVIDKGLGLRAFEDMLRLSGPYIDFIKLGFGTAALYPPDILRRKIALAGEHGVAIMPGGTFLEVAIAQQEVDAFFQTVVRFGFTALEVSDGTIEMSRSLRSSLIVRGVNEGMKVLTEYGKKRWGSTIVAEELAETVQIDTGLGALFVTVEGRESGAGVGIYDENGRMRDDALAAVIEAVKTPELLMWEAPQKNQQAKLLQMFGPEVHIGNVAPDDVLSLEALRRGLRSDTFQLGPGAKVK